MLFILMYFLLNLVHLTKLEREYLEMKDYSLVKNITIKYTPDYAVIILETKNAELPIIISISQAISIEKGIRGERGFRPNTHDLLSDILKPFRGKYVTIDSLVNNVYIATLWVDGSPVDCRPSDCIAVAVRLKIPIFVKNSLLIKEKKEKVEIGKVIAV